MEELEMKKATLVTVVVAMFMLFSQAAFAADFVGGGIGFGFGKFNIVPNVVVDYNFNKNISVNGWMGLQLVFDEDNKTQTNFMGTVFGRYNFLDQDDMTLGVQAGANISSNFTLAVGPFISFDLNPNWTIYADGSIGLLTTSGRAFDRGTITAGAQYDLKSNLAIRGEYRLVNGRSMVIGTVGYIF